jgi:hypothetical protein
MKYKYKDYNGFGGSYMESNGCLKCRSEIPEDRLYCNECLAKISKTTSQQIDGMNVQRS